MLVSTLIGLLTWIWPNPFKRHPKWRKLFIVAFFAVLLGGIIIWSFPESALLHGVVKDAETGDPLKDSSITLCKYPAGTPIEATAISVDDGTYQIVNLKSKHYVRIAEKLGYVRATSTLELQRGENIHDILLRPIKAGEGVLTFVRALDVPWQTQSLKQADVSMEVINAELAFLQTASFSRQILLVSLRFKNESDSVVFLDLSKSYVGGLTAGLKPGMTASYDFAASSFIPNAATEELIKLDPYEGLEKAFIFTAVKLPEVPNSVTSVAPNITFWKPAPFPFPWGDVRYYNLFSPELPEL